MRAICINSSRIYHLKPPFKEGEVLEVKQSPYWQNNYIVINYNIEKHWLKSRFILLSSKDEMDYIKIKTRHIGV